MRILVVGAGAVGGYFGARLAEAGRDITFLVRARRADELKASGLQILSPHGDLTLHPKVVTAQQLSEPYDLILLSVKSYAIASAMDDFAPAIGPRAMIIPMLNGMRHMDLLAERFGADSVLGGVCRVSAEIDAEGRIKQLAGFQSLSYGEVDGARTARIESVDATLRGAGFDASISEDIMGAMWQKWVQLSSLGGINCLLRGSIGQIVDAPGGADLSVSMIKECAGIANACGHPQTEAFLAQHQAALTAKGSPLTSSMYRDLQKGLPVEADTIVGDLLRRGKMNGISSPLLEAAFVSLSIYQPGR
ncbi:MAG TPA: 2-dehydropantoate 2-reductase [Bryobacteraceae bacterium]|jgi:2-dehydropantoate 2-reductase